MAQVLLAVRCIALTVFLTQARSRNVQARHVQQPAAIQLHGDSV